MDNTNNDSNEDRKICSGSLFQEDCPFYFLPPNKESDSTTALSQQQHYHHEHYHHQSIAANNNYKATNYHSLAQAAPRTIGQGQLSAGQHISAVAHTTNPMPFRSSSGRHSSTMETTNEFSPDTTEQPYPYDYQPRDPYEQQVAPQNHEQQWQDQHQRNYCVGDKAPQQEESRSSIPFNFNNRGYSADSYYSSAKQGRTAGTTDDNYWNSYYYSANHNNQNDNTRDSSSSSVSYWDSMPRHHHHHHWQQVQNHWLQQDYYRHTNDHQFYHPPESGFYHYPQFPQRSEGSSGHSPPYRLPTNVSSSKGQLCTHHSKTSSSSSPTTTTTSPRCAKIKKTKRQRVEGEPIRPLTAYNIYFKTQRAILIRDKTTTTTTNTSTTAKEDKKEDNTEEKDLLQAENLDGVAMKTENHRNKEIEKATDKDKKEEDNNIDSATTAAEAFMSYIADRAAKSQANNNKKKRNKPHHKMTFQDMARIIAQQWNAETSIVKKKYCELADQDRQRYEKEKQVFLLRQQEKRKLDNNSVPSNAS